MPPRGGDVIEISTDEDDAAVVARAPTRPKPNHTPGRARQGDAGNVRALESRVKALQSELVEARRRKDAKDKQVSELSKTKLALHQELEGLRMETSALRNRRERDEVEIAELSREKTELEAEVRGLKAEADGTIRLGIADVREILSCGVCLEVILHPWILPGCGHSYCHHCLREWFTTILTKFHGGDIPLPLTDDEALYNCPECQSPVRSRPKQNYSLKAFASLCYTVTLNQLPPDPAPLQANTFDDFFPW